MAYPRSGLFSGMQTSALKAALATAQQALLDVTTGAKGESFSYTQGDGAKAVTYTSADIPALEQTIYRLQYQLGAFTRRPMRFKF